MRASRSPSRAERRGREQCFPTPWYKRPPVAAGQPGTRTRAPSGDSGEGPRGAGRESRNQQYAGETPRKYVGQPSNPDLLRWKNARPRCFTTEEEKKTRKNIRSNILSCQGGLILLALPLALERRNDAYQYLVIFCPRSCNGRYVQ